MLTSPLHFIIHTLNRRVLTLKHDLSTQGTRPPLEHCFALSSICILLSAVLSQERNGIEQELLSARRELDATQVKVLNSAREREATLQQFAALRNDAKRYGTLQYSLDTISLGCSN